VAQISGTLSADVDTYQLPNHPDWHEYELFLMMLSREIHISERSAIRTPEREEVLRTVEFERSAFGRNDGPAATSKT
jgi:hypothetical protein